MNQETGRFRAVSDDGEEFVVIERQPVREHRDYSGRVSITKGLKRLILSDGSSVNRIDAETFQIVQSNKIIRKL